VAAAAATVFAGAFILDTAALMRLAWACMAGHFGFRVRVAAIAITGLMIAMVIWALIHPQPAPPPISRKTRRCQVRKAGQADGAGTARPAAAMPVPGDPPPGPSVDAMPTARRRARRAAAAKADQPLPG